MTTNYIIAWRSFSLNYECSFIGHPLLVPGGTDTKYPNCCLVKWSPIQISVEIKLLHWKQSLKLLQVSLYKQFQPTRDEEKMKVSRESPVLPVKMCFASHLKFTRKGLMQHKRKNREGNTRFSFPACLMQPQKCFLTAPHVLKRNSSMCNQQGGLCRCRLAYGISNFSVTSGMLAEQQSSREKDVLLITPCCPHPQAESYCFMQMSS